MTTPSIAIATTQGEFLKNVGGVLPIYSLAKPLIAAAVFTTDVDIQAPISNWIDPDWVPRANDISVAQLLNHTSGLPDYGPLSQYAEAIRSGQGPWSDDTFAEHTLRQPLLFEPGTAWSYSNPGYWLLAQIIQRETKLTFDEVINDRIAQPLGLTSTRVVHGQFAADLPWYPAEWVWHGLVVSNAQDMVTFMQSTMVDPLHTQLVKVPVQHPLWTDPHNGYGLMVDPGIKFGHNGDGPGYSASCFQFVDSGLTGCVIMPTANEGEAMQMLVEEIAGCLDS